MNYKTTIAILVFIIAIFAIAAATTGAFFNDVTGPYQYTSIRAKAAPPFLLKMCYDNRHDRIKSAS